MGLYVFIDIEDLGLVLQWDKGNKLYVRLQRKWKGLVTGLCGNFNSDSTDDFKSSSGIVEGSAELFGNSWKLHNYCPKATKIQV